MNIHKMLDVNPKLLDKLVDESETFRVGDFVLAGQKNHYLGNIPRMLYKIVGRKSISATILDTDTHATQTISLASLVKIDQELVDSWKTAHTTITKNRTLFGSNERMNAFVHKMLQKICSKLYPEERFEVRKFEHIRGAVLFLHYPEITLTNTPGQTHTIKDLFARIVILGKLNKGLKLATIEFMRTTFHESEFLDSRRIYCHSHLPRSLDPRGWVNSFCWGTNTQIACLMDRLSEFKTFDWRGLSSFLVQLESTLAWESLEGGPYTTIGEVKRTTPKYEAVLDDPIETVLGNIDINNVLSKLGKFSFKVHKDGITLTNIAKERLHHILTENLLDSGKEEYIFSFAPVDKNIDYLEGRSLRKPEEGKFLNPNPNLERLAGSYTNFTFKGEKLNIKIIPFSPQDLGTNKDKSLAHINILKEVVNIIETEFTDYLLKQKL